MAKLEFTTIAVFHYGELVDLLYGKGPGLMQTLKKSQHWDTIQEELSDNTEDSFDTIEELAEMHKEEASFYTIRIKLFTNQIYYN